MKTDVNPPRGMRDQLPADQTVRRLVNEVVRDAVDRRGFSEIETPAMETLDRLTSKLGGENESMLFEVLKRGIDRTEPASPETLVDLGLRYDLTLPLTRFYATHKPKLPPVFRAFQCGNVWRAERPQKGRYRQFTQCDIDIIGDSSTAAEVEVLAAAWGVLAKLELTNSSVVEINDRRILYAIMRDSGISESQSGAVLISLDKLGKIGPEKVKAELVTKGQLSDLEVSGLFEALSAYSAISADDLMEGQLSNPALIELATIVRTLREIYPEISIRFTPTLVRGMGYYTGPIFEVTNSFASGSICGGGRYDGMIGRWSGTDVPAVGFSFGFERIVSLLQSQGLPSNDNLDTIALLYKSDDERTRAVVLCNELADASSSASFILNEQPRRPRAAFFESLREQGASHYVSMEVIESTPQDYGLLKTLATPLE